MAICRLFTSRCFYCGLVRLPESGVSYATGKYTCYSEMGDCVVGCLSVVVLRRQHGDFIKRYSRIFGYVGLTFQIVPKSLWAWNRLANHCGGRGPILVLALNLVFLSSQLHRFVYSWSSNRVIHQQAQAKTGGVKHIWSISEAHLQIWGIRPCGQPRIQLETDEWVLLSQWDRLPRSAVLRPPNKNRKGRLKWRKSASIV